MSDRGNVLFYNEEDSSVIVSSYWGSLGFVVDAIHYAIELKTIVDKFKEEHPNLSSPLTRLEPDLIVVDFIRYLHDRGWITERDSGVHLYKTEREVEKVHKIDLNNPSELLSSDDIKRYWDRR